jgi:hypothetical protein
VFFHIISSAYIGMQKNRNYFYGGPWGEVEHELQPIAILNSAFAIASKIPKTGLVIAKVSVWTTCHIH